MNTDNTFNQLIAGTFTSINDEVFCNLVDNGIDPGYAYQLAFIDTPFEALDSVETIQSSQSEDFDDVDAFLQ